MSTLSPELESLAKSAVEQIAIAEGVGSFRKTIEASVYGAIDSIFDHEARVKRRSSPDTDVRRAERRKSYLGHFSKADTSVAEKIVDLAMQQ